MGQAPELRVLRDKEIELIPSRDTEYLLELASKDRFKELDDSANRYALPFIKYLWHGYADHIRAGVIFLCYLPALGWTLDAYKDDALLKAHNNKGDFSFRAGQLVIDWFFKSHDSQELFTGHVLANRGATLVCKRLGFKEFKTINLLFLKLTR